MSGSIRLFVRHALREGASVVLSAAQAHYLGTVLRRGPGAALLLFNGTDGEFAATLATIRRDRAEAVLGARLRPAAAAGELRLLFAPLKRDATDFLVQKATELGASLLQPVQTARTNAARINPERLAAIAVEAAEQCERLDLPDILPLTPLPAVLALWPAHLPLFAALERAAAPPLRPHAGPAGLLVGPEGGFTEAERALLARHAFVRPVSLGPRILRAETAGIVGLALLQAAGWE